MAFELPFPPFPHDSRDVPFIATPDDNNGYAVPSSQYFKKLVGEKYLWTPVSSTDPLPSSDAAAQAKLADILTKLSADPATQTTLAQILAKIIAAPATEAKQTALNALIGEVQAAPTANTLLARLKSLEDKIAAIIAGTSPAVTTLSGSNIKSTVVMFERAVRTTSISSASINIPAGTKSMVVAVRIYGVTGTFEAGQGLILKSGTMNIGPEINPMIYDTVNAIKTINSSISHHWGNGITKGDAVPFNTSRFNYFGGFLGGTSVSGFIGITGTFAEGEGIDCGANVYFLG